MAAVPKLQLVLASSSPFRRQLLERLAIPFQTAAPDVDERPLPGETAEDLVRRLARAKAAAIAARRPEALVIGSDQVAVIDGEIIGKPGDHAAATRQLERAAGKTVRFLTGLCLIHAPSGRTQLEVVPFAVEFRALSAQQIENYLRREQPYDCAGSFRSEGLGIALFERLIGDDPTALIGLPLIRLVRMLEQEGLRIP